MRCMVRLALLPETNPWSITVLNYVVHRYGTGEELLVEKRKLETGYTTNRHLPSFTHDHTPAKRAEIGVRSNNAHEWPMVRQEDVKRCVALALAVAYDGNGP